MKLAVYVAASSPDWQRARILADRLEATGLVRITGRWYESVANWGVGRDHELTRDQQAEHATADLMAVDAATVFLALWGEHKSEGLGVELGYALGRDDVHVLVAGPHAKRCIFAALAGAVVETDELAFDAVLDIAAAQQPAEHIEVPGLVAGMERP